MLRGFVDSFMSCLTSSLRDGTIVSRFPKSFVVFAVCAQVTSYLHLSLANQGELSMRSNGERTATLEDLVDMNLWMKLENQSLSLNNEKKMWGETLLSVVSLFCCVNEATWYITDIHHTHRTVFFLLFQNLLLASMFLTAMVLDAAWCHLFWQPIRPGKEAQSVTQGAFFIEIMLGTWGSFEENMFTSASGSFPLIFLGGSQSERHYSVP